MSQITNFLPKYRELNTLFADIVNSGKIGYWQQQDITEFYKQFSDIQAFEKMLLDIVLEKDKYTYTLILSSIKTEVEKNISLYESAKAFLNNIDTEKICLAQDHVYDCDIEEQMKFVNEYSIKLRKIDRALDTLSFRKYNPKAEKRLWQRQDYLKGLYNEEKEKLDEFFKLRKEIRDEAVKYRQNLFEKICTLSIAYLKIVDCYIAHNTTPIENEIKTVEEVNELMPKVIQEIEPNMIFRTKMYDKFLVLEKKLIANNYLNGDLRWVSVHENGKQDVKRLIVFLTALINNNYFLPNRDAKIKTFFETRYQINIGQNFEKKRREPLADEYKVVFYDYPF